MHVSKNAKLTGLPSLLNTEPSSHQYADDYQGHWLSQSAAIATLSLVASRRVDSLAARICYNWQQLKTIVSRSFRPARCQSPAYLFTRLPVYLFTCSHRSQSIGSSLVPTNPGSFGESSSARLLCHLCGLCRYVANDRFWLMLATSLVSRLGSGKFVLVACLSISRGAPSAVLSAVARVFFPRADSGDMTMSPSDSLAILYQWPRAAVQIDFMLVVSSDVRHSRDRAVIGFTRPGRRSARLLLYPVNAHAVLSIRLSAIGIDDPFTLMRLFHGTQLFLSS